MANPQPEPQPQPQAHPQHIWFVMKRTLLHSTPIPTPLYGEPWHYHTTLLSASAELQGIKNYYTDAQYPPVDFDDATVPGVLKGFCLYSPKRGEDLVAWIVAVEEAPLSRVARGEGKEERETGYGLTDEGEMWIVDERTRVVGIVGEDGVGLRVVERKAEDSASEGENEIKQAYKPEDVASGGEGEIKQELE